MTHPRELSVPVLGVHTRAWQYGAGDGTPLLLVHGFRGDHHGLELVAEALAVMLPGTPIVVPDLPGFGASPAIPGREHDLALYGEWLRGFADALRSGQDQRGPDAPRGEQDQHGSDQHSPDPRTRDRRDRDGDPHVLGHSFGSLVVARALADGLRARSTVFVNPISSPALAGPNALMTKLAIAYYRAADALPARGARALLGNPAIVRVMSEVMAKTRDPEMRGWIHNQHARYFSVFSDPTTLLQAFRASVSHTVAGIVDEVIDGTVAEPRDEGRDESRDKQGERPFAGPTLIIAGDRDDISPLRAQLDLQHRIPGSELRVIPGVGHLVHYEAPEDAAVHIARFLRSAGAAGEGSP